MPNILKQDVDRPEFLSLINSMRSRKKDKVLDYHDMILNKAVIEKEFVGYKIEKKLFLENYL